MKHIDLSRGRITVQVNQQHSHWALDDLLDFAERINPKRAFLFVSKVLGKHIPVAPSVMQRSYSDLASLVPTDLAGPICVIGMAETAVGLGQGVFESWLKLNNANATGDDSTPRSTTSSRLRLKRATKSLSSRKALHIATPNLAKSPMRGSLVICTVGKNAKVLTIRSYSAPVSCG